MRQRALHDDRNAALHGGERFRNGRVRDFNAVDPDDVQPRLGQVLDVALFMGSPRVPHKICRSGSQTFGFAKAPSATARSRPAR